MAFLTNFSFGKLSREVDIKHPIDKELFVKEIYNNVDLYYMLNRKEIRTLFSYKGILVDERNFLINHYQDVPVQEDKKVYVFEKRSKVKYHLLRECELLTKDFQNFYIPPQIRQINDEYLTEAYRNWFKEHGFKEDYLSSLNSGDTQRAQKRIVDSYNYKFRSENLKFDLDKLPMDLKFYNHVDNSKSKFAEEEFDKEQFIAQVETLIKKHDEYFHSHALRKFSKFSGMIDDPEEQINSVLSEVFPEGLVKRIGIERIKKEWSMSNSIKKEILHLLFKYFRWAHGFHKKDFDVLTLEDFGLECCSRCKKYS